MELEANQELGTGDPNSNWAWFEKQKAAYVNVSLRATSGDLPLFDDAEEAADNGRIEANFRRLGPSIIFKDSKIGRASDFWNHYKEDIQRAKDLGTAPHELLPTTDCKYNGCPKQ